MIEAVAGIQKPVIEAVAGVQKPVIEAVAGVQKPVIEAVAGVGSHRRREGATTHDQPAAPAATSQGAHPTEAVARGDP